MSDILKIEQPAPETQLAPLSRRHLLMVALPLLFLIAGAAGFWSFVSYAVMSNPALNGLIFAVMAWGSTTMFMITANVYAEDRVFRAGLAWLRRGVWSGEQDPRLGPGAYVIGMIERLQKLGLGHQVYLHSSAMEPELTALEHNFERKQELSQFLVGLMVGLGLLGTFVGLLETLVKTSALIGTIAHGASGGGDMAQEFAKIVGGLQAPLSAMGTAFSASMFGLVGSIMLGFQMVMVRRTAQDFVERVREEVLSLAEKSQGQTQVEVTERFLATLLADILQSNRQTTSALADIVGRLDRGLAEVVARIEELVPEVRAAAGASEGLMHSLQSQQAVLEQSVATVGRVAEVVPRMGELASHAGALLGEAAETRLAVEHMVAFLPRQNALVDDVERTLARIDLLADSVDALRGEVRRQSAAIQRMDGTVYNTEKEALRAALLAAAEPPPKEQPK